MSTGDVLLFCHMTVRRAAAQDRHLFSVSLRKSSLAPLHSSSLFAAFLSFGPESYSFCMFH